MREDKVKHLEFIQSVVARMNSNSFLIKGWAITLVSALFALAAKDANVSYVLITYFALPVFWSLDGFFLSTERQYRHLYDRVRIRAHEDIDFDMNASPFGTGNASWWSSMLSITIWPFYVSTLIVTFGVMYLLGG